MDFKIFRSDSFGQKIAPISTIAIISESGLLICGIKLTEKNTSGAYRRIFRYKITAAARPKKACG